MKKTLSVLAVLGVVSVMGTQTANAFDWSNLNPAYWGHCPKCEKKKPDCECKKVKKCDPCTTGAAAPCDPCAKKIQPAPCDPCAKKAPCSVPVQQPCAPCDRLQQMAR